MVVPCPPRSSDLMFVTARSMNSGSRSGQVAGLGVEQGFSLLCNWRWSCRTRSRMLRPFFFVTEMLSRFRYS